MKNTYNLESPINIPEQKLGKFSIKREIFRTGEKMTIISMRDAIFCGERPSSLLLDKDRTVHKLSRRKEDDGLMMSDTPQELWGMSEGVKKAKGRVLVGGLGLGCYANMIIKKRSVKEVIVVEIEPKIIKMVKPYIDKRIKIIEGDIYEVIKNKSIKFDFAFLDIWYGTGEMAYEYDVLPLKRLIGQEYGEKPIECWAEKTMIGQFKQKFLGWLVMMPTPKQCSFSIIYYVFLKKLYELDYTQYNMEEQKALVLVLCEDLFNNVGTNGWEKYWQWDKREKEAKKLSKIKNERR